MVIKRVGPVSCGKIAGILYGIIGLVVGTVISIVAMTGGFASSTGGPGGPMIGVGAIVAVPMLYGGLGAIAAIIFAALYNFLASIVGGIEVDIE